MGYIPTILVALALTISAASAGCASAPAYSQDLTRLAGAQPQEGPPAPKSQCESQASCENECAAGAAHACTLVGDMAFAGNPARAESLWLRACKSRDGEGCLRLMSLTASDVELADAFARRACHYQSTTGCEMFGLGVALQALTTPAVDTRASQLKRAVWGFERSCDLGEWSSCLWAETVHNRDELESPESRASSLRKKALAHAVVACGEKESAACSFVAREGNKAGNIAAPNTGPAPRHRADKPLRVSPRILAARRVSGRDPIEPPEPVEALIRDSNATSVAATMMFCLTPSGLARSVAIQKSSGFLAYDRVIFETMRTWRYRPYLVDGKPVPVCAPVTIVAKGAKNAPPSEEPRDSIGPPENYCL